MQTLSSETPAVLSQLVQDCQAALHAQEPRRAVFAHVQELLSDPAAFAAKIPAFEADEIEQSPLGWTLGGEHVAHRSADLTVMILDTLPGVVQPPHEHNMNVVIGVFEGCEEQRFWSRTADGIEPTTGRMLEAGEVVALGAQAIHAISAPPSQPARAVHVYLGDIYDVERSVFHPESLEELPMTSERYDSFCLADPRS